ncbi:MAG: RND family transporter, partial [Dehalococcoidales bacterium]|nr:RND family transporter [Dehalococcoidales bacterium]
TFGGEAINVLVTGNIDTVFSADNIERLQRFEASVLADSRYRSITSPLSLFTIAVQKAEAAAEAMQFQLFQAQELAAQQAQAMAAAAGLSEAEQEAAAEQAKAAVLAEAQPQLEALAQLGPISLDNPLFIQSVLYDENGDINQDFARLMPDSEHALISIVPEGNKTDAQELALTRAIQTKLDESGFTDIEASVISYPEIVDAISVGLSNNLKLLLGLAVVVMALILFTLFRVRWRLLSLVMVGMSALWTFGLMGYISIPLTMTSMAVLPILIGLGIDFSIQFHNRYQEEIVRCANVNEAVVASMSRMMPVVGIALLATLIGFVTLFISEIPMIKDFGIALTIGIFFSYLIALFVLNSVILIGDRNVPMPRLRASATRATGRAERILIRFGRLAISHTWWIVIISLLFAAGGGWVDHLIKVNTDYETLMQQDSEALKEIRKLRDILGIGGSITFIIEADDVTSPEILTWMNTFQNTVTGTHEEILTVNSPATIISQASGGIIPGEEQIDTILANTPVFFRDQVISEDAGTAGMTYTLKYITLEEVNRLIDEIKETAAPPDGVSISPVGSMAIGAKIMDSVVGSRMTMNLICLGATFMVLLLVYRRLDRTIFTVIPVALVIAWSSLDMYLTGIPINPLTAILGVLVIGICTEYMILLTGRYEEEKEGGLRPREAMATAISRIGKAIIASSVTTLGGFGILIVSDFVLIRDFGIVTLLGVLLCLLITVTVMPGVIAWYDTFRLRIQEKRKA